MNNKYLSIYRCQLNVDNNGFVLAISQDPTRKKAWILTEKSAFFLIFLIKLKQKYEFHC